MCPLWFSLAWIVVVFLNIHLKIRNHKTESDSGIKLLNWLKLETKVNMLLVAKRTKFSSGDISDVTVSSFLYFCLFNMNPRWHTVKIQKYCMNVIKYQWEFESDGSFLCLSFTLYYIKVHHWTIKFDNFLIIKNDSECKI